MTLWRTAPIVINNLRRNHYKLLGIQRTDDQKEIKTAYLKQAKLLHPDSNPGDPNAQEKFQSLQSAYEVLKDKNSKMEYDMTLRPETTGSGTGSNNRDFFKERGGYDIYNETNDWFTHRGRTESERGKNFSYEQEFEDFDPWNSHFRNNRARRFWEDIESQFGGQEYDYYFTESRNIYDEFYDEEYDDLEYSQWERQFRDRIFHDHNWDFDDENYNPRNGNHQRYNYHDQNNWEQYNYQRSEYERAFNDRKKFQEDYDSNFSKRSRKQKQKEAKRNNQRYREDPMADNWKYESKFNRAYGFNRTDGFSGRNIWNSRHDYMSDDYMDDWENWTKTAYSETSRNIDRKNRNSGKKRKKSSEKRSAGDEFYAKLRKHGSTVIEIDGDKFKVQLKNDGEIQFTKLK